MGSAKYKWNIMLALLFLELSVLQKMRTSLCQREGTVLPASTPVLHQEKYAKFGSMYVEKCS